MFYFLFSRRTSRGTDLAGGFFAKLFLKKSVYTLFFALLSFLPENVSEVETCRGIFCQAFFEKGWGSEGGGKLFFPRKAERRLRCNCGLPFGEPQGKRGCIVRRVPVRATRRYPPAGATRPFPRAPIPFQKKRYIWGDRADSSGERSLSKHTVPPSRSSSIALTKTGGVLYDFCVGGGRSHGWTRTNTDRHGRAPAVNKFTAAPPS